MAYASQRAEVLFGCYRRGDANDPERYVAAVAAVLSLYDADLIREVTDPRTGIQTSEKFMSFMPNPGELKVYCEGLASRKDRLKKLGARKVASPPDRYLPAPDPVPRDLANFFVPAGHQRYANLVEWSKTANPRMWKFGKSSDGRDGIWISWDVWDRGHVTIRPKAAAESKSFSLSEAALKAMRDVDAVREGTLPLENEEGQ